MQLGQYTVRLLDVGRFGLDGGAMFGVVPKPLWSKAYHPGDAVNRIPMATRLLLIEWDDRRLLVDTGNGTKLAPKLRDIYAIDATFPPLEVALTNAGILPESITDVVLTHLHFDHAGGATRFDGTNIVPTFPNARYYVQADQLAWARNPTEKDRASFFPENFEPLMDAGVLDTLEGSVHLTAELSLHPLFGHTQAMQVLLLQTDDGTLFYPADLLPTSAHVPIPYVMGYDNYPLTTIREKKHWLERATREQWIVVFEHDAFVAAGTIASTDKGYALGNPVSIEQYTPVHAEQ
ncbi:MAG: MBL fold metallo-hydrolase [Bacteroidota bacterium]|nr:MBL fold metallo-hydrolase [Candidatus Kapabacteria bacterium]MCS7301891.1 MBL fold metallo-hydrolase [Candidatus Kapabacteria bacterium]MCX7936144.1 MBL fold metallo-hydrolase [Chlorobiota bacterium]MDW8074962.1 MBL fold metallo-hydrolase [Bacteroidota bacterium]MDW8271601.1 MBL fold metallo-hydrolase [Bacteroidota bacterium]